MLFFDTEIKSSKLGGLGCFVTCAVDKGAIAGILVYRGRLIKESEYLEALSRGESAALRTGTRWVGSYLTIDDPHDPFVIASPNEAFINHSFDPTLLFHCGICFAKRDLAAGEELTVDYAYVLSPVDPTVFSDTVTGEPVRGLPWRTALLRSAVELIAVYGGER
jgi:hypothetical protein